MIRRPPRSTLDRSSAASDVYKRQQQEQEKKFLKKIDFFKMESDFLRQVYLELNQGDDCLLYTSPSPRDRTRSRMPSSA